VRQFTLIFLKKLLDFTIVLTLQIVRNFAHELPIKPDLYDALAYSHWHADHSDKKVGDWQVHQEVVGDTAKEAKYFKILHLCISIDL
jgi:hypothetical protein